MSNTTTSNDNECVPDSDAPASVSFFLFHTNIDISIT